MIAQNLNHEVCGVIIKCGTVRSMCTLHARSAPRNRRSPRRHWCTCCACRSSCCDDAVVRRTLVLIAFIVAFVFVVSILRRNLLYWRYSVYRCCCVGFGQNLSPLVTIEDVRYYGAMKASKTFNPVHHVLVGSHQFPNLQTRDSDMMDLQSGDFFDSTAHCPSRRQQSLNLFCTPSLLWLRIPED